MIYRIAAWIAFIIVMAGVHGDHVHGRPIEMSVDLILAGVIFVSIQVSKANSRLRAIRDRVEKIAIISETF
jgi:hypothetical protein